MSVLCKAERGVNLERAKVVRFRPAREREAKKKRDDWRLAIADCRLKSDGGSDLQSEIGN
jgi:hypothetical protein